MCSVERRGGGVFEESGRGARLPVVRRANAQKTLVRRRGYDRCHGRNGSRHVQIFGASVRVFCSGGACGRSEYPCPPPARPMAAAVANDMEATLRAAGVKNPDSAAAELARQDLDWNLLTSTFDRGGGSSVNALLPSTSLNAGAIANIVNHLHTKKHGHASSR